MTYKLDSFYFKCCFLKKSINEFYCVHQLLYATAIGIAIGSNKRCKLEHINKTVIGLKFI